MESNLDNSAFFEKNDLITGLGTVANTEGTQNDLSFSMVVDNRSQSQKSFSTIQPRTRTRWVENNSVGKCSCGTYFGFFTSRHHCRNCGQIFCYACVSQKIEIPKYLNTPKPATGKEFNDTHNVKVCKDCYLKVYQVKQIEVSIEVFNLVNLDIFDFKKMTKVCKTWNQLSNFYLSKIREIQYSLPTHTYDEYEKNALWINRNYFVGHNIWMTHLFRSIDYLKEPDKKDEILRLLNEHISSILDKKQSRNCWELMCTRRCQHELSSECALMLLDPDVNLPEIRQFAINYLFSDNVETDELCCYIQYLVQCATVSKHSIIIDSLLQEAYKFEVGRGMECDMNKRCIRILSELYWELQIGIKSKSVFLVQKYQEMLDSFLNHIHPPFYTIILKTVELVDKIQDNYNSDNPVKIIQSLADVENAVSPLHTDYGEFTIDAAHIEIKQSMTKPVIVPMVNSHGERVVCMEKNDDIRKDQIVLSVIKLMDLVLKKEMGEDLGIVTYRIRPTSPSRGFVEIVDNCCTLYSIQKNQMTLLQHILDKNPESTAKAIRDRFMKSCAAYCVISFLLGVGDRHLENLMVTDDARLFHIDYGFILGQDPKFIKLDDMRITPEMLDALGGYNSESYQQFKKLCDEIYNILRRHLNLFACLLNLFVITNPKIEGSKYFTENRVLREIAKRFAPGENYKEAKVQLHNRIENSTTAGMSLRYGIIDFFHKHNKEQTVKTAFSTTASTTYSTTKGLIGKIWDLIVSTSDVDV